ncbi:MAG: C1 family peptidase [Pseudomonadota bacterium]
MEEWKGNSLQGCLFSTTPDTAPSMKFASQAPLLSDQSLPKSVDLRPHCTAVEDQGRSNSCTANAVVGAMEYHLAKRDGRTTDLSRLFVYFNTRRLNGTFVMDMGATIPHAMAAALAFGACRAALWPYDLSRLNVHPPMEAYKDAMGQEALQYARAGGVDGAVRALAAGLPVAFGVNLPKRCYDEAAQSGVMPITTAAERANKPNFGHAMLLVGYDLPSRRFVLRNSWGPSWGDGGYATVAFEDLEHCAPAEQFWTLSDMEPAQSFRISRPGAFVQEPAASRGAGAPRAPSANAPSAVFGRPAPQAAAPAGSSAGLGSARSAADRLRAELRGEIDAGRKSLSDRISGLRAGSTAPRPSAGLSAGPAPRPTPTPSGARPTAFADPQPDPTNTPETTPQNDRGVIIPAPADSPYPVVAAEEYPPGMELIYAETECVICFGTGKCEMCGGVGCDWCFTNPGLCRTCHGMKRIVLVVPKKPKSVEPEPEKKEEPKE